MISSSRVFASSNSSRATGWSRIAGYLPFSSQARKRNCQSIISRSAVSVGSTRPDAGERRDRQVVEGDLLAVGPGLREGQQRRAAAAGVLLAQPLLLGPVASRPAPRPGRRSSRSETTPTTRDASSTCTVVPS